MELSFAMPSFPFATFVVQTHDAVVTRILQRRGDDYGEKAVILVLVVLAGIAAFTLFGNKISSLINKASSGI